MRVNETFNEAKKIYFDHACNHFFMSRNDESAEQEYGSFHVPEEIERLWDKEFVE
jgi:hypothetical protein